MEVVRLNGEALAQKTLTGHNLTITIIWDSVNGLTYEGMLLCHHYHKRSLIGQDRHLLITVADAHRRWD
jgi:hypothetical protein